MTSVKGTNSIQTHQRVAEHGRYALARGFTETELGVLDWKPGRELEDCDWSPEAVHQAATGKLQEQG